MMKEKDITNQFAKYVVPSMLAMVLAGFYSITDGFFVGQAMGDDGLAAINLAWPLTVLLTSTGIGLGTGGAIIMSIKMGERDIISSQRAEGTTLVLLFFASIVFTTIYACFVPQLLKLLGAEGILYDYGLSYMKVITWGAFFQIMGSGMAPILKNLGKPGLAMVFMVLGMLTNIVLDAVTLFVFDMGLEGIALATCTGQGVVFVCAIVIVIREKLCTKWYIPVFNLAKQIVKIGASPFGLTMAPGIVILITNWQSLNYGGSGSVAVYTVMSYAAYVVYSMMQGMADGVQPILSYCKGAGELEAMGRTLKKAFLLAGVISVLFIGLIVLVRYQFPLICGASEKVALDSIPAMLCLALAVPFVAIARIMSGYFYAVDDSRSSSILVYVDPFLFSPLYLLILPIFFGTTGIWLAYPATQLSIALLVPVLQKLRNRRARNNADNQQQSS